MPDLPSLIQQLRDQGYSDDYIKRYLQDYDYTDEEIEQHLHPNEVHHTHHLTLTTILTLLTVTAVIGGTAYLGIQYFSGEPLLDVTLEPARTTFQPGQTVSYRVKITNMGTKDTFDVHLQHKLIHDTNVQRTTEETIAVSTTTTQINELPTPPPGQYTMKTIATYGDKQAEASFTFTVTPTKEPTPNREPTNTTNQREQNRSQTTNTTTNTTVDATATLQHVREIATTRPSTAEEKCMKLTGEDRDDCLSLVVRKSQRPEFCKNINADQTRDNCYMNFIIEGQAHLCNKVVLNSSKNYCNRLEDVQIMAQYQN